ncbi:MAG: YqiA/YcfP family alpha/beta fold hydrolase, partial [Betaproteobacteria bacterium]
EIEVLLHARAIDTSTLTFIGSSLGGYYATWLAERHQARAVVINPAVQPQASLETFLGPQRNPYTGEAYVLTAAHLDDMRALRVVRITHPQRYFLLVRSGDELLDWRQAVAYYAGGWQYVAGGGDHGWTDFAGEAASVLHFACSAAWHPR